MKEDVNDLKNNSISITESIKDKIIDWTERYSTQKPAIWDRLPDIELYMDQVVTFLDRQFLIQRRNDEDKIVTPSMINNYTKDHVIPRAESKKYSREHIALLMIVGSLKKVMSMPDLSELLNDFKLNENDNIEKFYELFIEFQNEAVSNTSSIVLEGVKSINEENEREILRNLALQLSVEAQARCVAAQQILTIIGEPTKK